MAEEKKDVSPNRAQYGGLDPELRAKFDKAQRENPSRMGPAIKAALDSERMAYWPEWQFNPDGE